MKSLKTIIKQLNCLHYWHKGLPVDIVMGKGYKYEYWCSECEKIIYRWTGEEPVSGIIKDVDYLIAEYKKDPLYRVSPSFIVKSDD